MAKVTQQQMKHAEKDLAFAIKLHKDAFDRLLIAQDRYSKATDLIHFRQEELDKLKGAAMADAVIEARKQEG